MVNSLVAFAKVLLIISYEPIIGIKVDAEGMKYLSKALKMNTTLTQLDLSGT